MITLINGERFRQTFLPSTSSFTFVVNFTLSSLIFFIIMNNQKIILVSCFKNLSFIQGRDCVILCLMIEPIMDLI